MDPFWYLPRDTTFKPIAGSSRLNMGRSEAETQESATGLYDESYQTFWC